MVVVVVFVVLAVTAAVVFVAANLATMRRQMH
jgi:hypothetical protein